MRHIRKTDQGGRDRRTTGRRHANNYAPTYCGAEPTVDDMGRKGALQVIDNVRRVPQIKHHLDGVCESCVQALSNS